MPAVRGGPHHQAGRDGDRPAACPGTSEAAEAGAAEHEDPAAVVSLPLADWLILAALAVVILLAVRYARTHPKIPPR